MRRPLILLLALCVPATAAPRRAGSGSALKIHDVLPRDSIQSVNRPRFTSVSRAGLPSTEPVMGFRVGEEAHVYSLNLLNSHEIVNDRIGAVAFAATW